MYIVKGMSPQKSAEENVRALQEALDRTGTVFVGEPGVYELDRSVIIHSNTTLIFGNGVTIKLVLRADEPEKVSYAFINEGAYTGRTDRNISVIGLHLVCNGIDWHNYNAITGLRGHVSFFHIENLLIDDFDCPDVGSASYCVQICDFCNIRLENIHIEGNKDGIHLGCGSGFVIRHCRFRTHDDPIALNAHDYTSGNPMLGWIQNGIIEDCTDLDAPSTDGFFCRILAGSWCDWKRGMEVRQSDSVVHNGRIYRVDNGPDGVVYKSVTPPEHESGTQTYDGIRWVMIQDNPVYSCGCRNIVFRDIFLQKKRPIAFSVHFDNDKYSRSCYPGSKAPVQSGLVFENIVSENEIPVLIAASTPVGSLRLNGCDLRGRIEFTSFENDAPDYGCASVYVTASDFDGCNIVCEKGRSAKLYTSACSGKAGLKGDVITD